MNLLSMTPLESIDYLDEVLGAEATPFKTRRAWETVKDEMLRQARKVAEDIIINVDCNSCGHQMQVKIDGEK